MLRLARRPRPQPAEPDPIAKRAEQMKSWAQEYAWRSGRIPTSYDHRA
jgi:hypothetical protein